MNKRQRLNHISQLLRVRRSISLSFMQQETGASRATLMRDLAALRDENGVPIRWDRDTGCYHWFDQGPDGEIAREAAGLWFTPAQALALVTLEHLLAQVQPGDMLQRYMAPFERRLQSIWRQSGERGVLGEQVRRRVRIIGLANRAVHPQFFETVGLALVRRKRLFLSYHARSDNTLSERTVSPQRLVYYRSNWYLDAWCHTRQALRSFSLDAIRQARVVDEPAADVADCDLEKILGAGYGIFSGDDVTWARLRFTPERSRWVAAEQWHPEQRGEWDAKGHWVLSIPYADERELVMDVLRHVPEVEILVPDELRRQIREKLLQGANRMGGVS